MSEKLYVDAQELLEDSFRLAANVIKSDFQPTFIVALWRGGVPMGVAVQDFLQYFGIKTDHIAIRTAYYSQIDIKAEQVAVYGMNYLIKQCRHEDRLLFVDDVFDTGRTLQAVISHLKAIARRNTPEDIRIAVPYYKPARNETDIVPDYYLHETEQWLKFPHSLEGLSMDELTQHRPALAAILKTAVPPPA
ncbi:MAG: hypoxanthine phosphoribosyltransferase [Alcanivorax sp.]|jgi:hypoxanthine phosphoribosyltransferase